MKHIKIVQYSKPDYDSVYLKQHLYSIYIGTRTVYFKNEVHLKRFLADSNRLLNDVLHSVNYIFYNLFAEYRKVWFYIDKIKHGNVDEQIINAVNSINKSLDWVVTRSRSSMNGNANSFSYLENVLKELFLIANHIKEILSDKDRFTDIKIIDGYIDQISSLIKRMNNWGKGMNKKFEFIKENES